MDLPDRQSVCINNEIVIAVPNSKMGEPELDDELPLVIKQEHCPLQQPFTISAYHCLWWCLFKLRYLTNEEKTLVTRNESRNKALFRHALMESRRALFTGKLSFQQACGLQVVIATRRVVCPTSNLITPAKEVYVLTINAINKTVFKFN